MNSQSVSNLSGGVKVVVTVDTQDLEDVVLVGINANDRPGLLLDISRGLHSLGLQLHHTEASVVLNRSLSIWRCEAIDNAELDAEEVRAVLCSLLENEGGAGAAKQRGLSVIRAVVTDNSSLLEKTLDDINFRATYKAAIIAVQKKDKTQVETLADIRFGSGLYSASFAIEFEGTDIISTPKVMSWCFRLTLIRRCWCRLLPIFMRDRQSKELAPEELAPETSSKQQWLA